MSEDLAAAIAHHKAGRLVEAERIYREFLEKNPRQPQLLHLLGGIAYQTGDAASAVKHYDAALAAERGPGDDTLHFNRGNALKALGRKTDAIGAFLKATKVNPANGSAFYNLGLLLHEDGRLSDADSAYRMALALQPDHAAGWNNLGVLMQEQGKLLDAEAALRLALQQDPDFPDAQFNLARLLRHTGRYQEAEEQVRRYLTLQPDKAEAHRVLGDTLLTQGRPEEAIEAYERSLDLDPTSASSAINRAIALNDLGRIEEAEAAFRTGQALDPADPVAHRGLALLLQRLGRREGAIEAYTKALAADPKDPESAFGLMVAQLPIVPASEAEAIEGRQDYARHLAGLQERFEGMGTEDRAVAARAVGQVQPFYLAYHGENDRDLQADYGGLCWSLMAARYPAWSTQPAPRRRTASDKLRVGFVSGFFHWHSVWTIPLRGWLEKLDRSRFALYGYYTQVRRDEATEAATDLCDSFYQGPRPVDWWAERILEDQVDVLIYPEIGMDPTTAKLAALRLCPVQCASLGHPETSGLPTIDYFLSSALMEPSDGDNHYTERLIRLPGLGVPYRPACPERPFLTREDFGLPQDGVLYWCCQSLFKYRPLHDEVFVRIAQEVPDAVFAFIEGAHPPITETFRKRLGQAFDQAGLQFDRHVRFVRRLSIGEFAALAAVSDLYLDSIGWTGFNSALESLHWGLPVVTMPGRFMRGRHASAVMTQLGVTETIAGTVDEFVATAVALGKDPVRRAELAGRILAARDALYEDGSAIAGLQSFLNGAVGPVTG